MDLSHDACYRIISQRDPRFDGRLFTAVKTTGVYCRPICPARTPLSKNVIFFPTAAAAQEAGFRPCLRCRPETAPDLGAWRGASNTVSRGLLLIEEGALDEASVDALASRLGVGERQLRRLFKKHLGASPLAVAQTRRVLLAKKLIAETQLTMAQIAFASGFSSIRRFNETFQQLFSRPPAELRRVGRAAGATGEAGEITLTLPYKPPYDWAAMAAFLAERAIEGVEIVEERLYSRTLRLGEAVGTVQVSPSEGDFLRASVRLSVLSELPSVISRLRRVFDLSCDPKPIAAHLARDERLAPLLAERPGLRTPGAWDGFEFACRAVLGQQVSVRSAARLAARLVAEIGEALPFPADGLARTFPTSASVAAADLSFMPMPRARAATLTAIAEAFEADPHLLSGQTDLEEATRRLSAIKGVGAWTAQYIALRQLRLPDAFPAQDVGLLRALTPKDGRRPSAKEVLELAEPWRPWRAYAAQHLWAALA
ncbi:MAG: DNA-3-methyladenine glycosylase 2 family protein [Caulobacteraceae bacterium]